MSTHTVSVERLRDIAGYERAHPAVTAVVERSGSHVKVCIVSRRSPEYGRQFEGMDLYRWPAERTVRSAMESRAQSVARTYGATYLGRRAAA